MGQVVRPPGGSAGCGVQHRSGLQALQTLSSGALLPCPGPGGPVWVLPPPALARATLPVLSPVLVLGLLRPCGRHAAQHCALSAVCVPAPALPGTWPRGSRGDALVLHPPGSWHPEPTVTPPSLGGGHGRPSVLACLPQWGPPKLVRESPLPPARCTCHPSCRGVRARPCPPVDQGLRPPPQSRGTRPPGVLHLPWAAPLDVKPWAVCTFAWTLHPVPRPGGRWPSRPRRAPGHSFPWGWGSVGGVCLGHGARSPALPGAPRPWVLRVPSCGKVLPGALVCGPRGQLLACSGSSRPTVATAWATAQKTWVSSGPPPSSHTQGPQASHCPSEWPLLGTLGTLRAFSRPRASLWASVGRPLRRSPAQRPLLGWCRGSLLRVLLTLCAPPPQASLVRQVSAEALPPGWPGWPGACSCFLVSALGGHLSLHLRRWHSSYAGLWFCSAWTCVC